ncbi:MAG: pantetheine-phosphate adenylyltransferase [Lachnospiraceae bacterium]|nr:pantetheine-phosphate adenylyltransferase [Lachnospiraceae bacterium]MBR4144006.1 pantetheine-phosphate adenylyltransferase [Lachnospiraceae bacterium]MBR4776376.1 pantetheine-phosphate adenylyltransferase [Lachnospiraceae bacterium]MBR6474984.1 pantetheine-phosphate adenylyltransferase [Lachnospiraceae bacterium]
MKIALYPGTFDPVTLGHLDIIRRAAGVCDKLVIGVLPNSEKRPWFSVEERIELIKKVTHDLDNVEVKSFDGLTVDFGKQLGASVIVRGLRAITDFEYELQIAQINHRLNPDIDTIFFTTSVEYSYVSSSIAKEVTRYGGDVSGLVPKEIIDDLFAKAKSRTK